jgi:hypothetical protein
MKTRPPRSDQAHLRRLLQRYERATLLGSITEMQRAGAAYHAAKRKMGLSGSSWRFKRAGLRRRARHTAMR